MWPAAWWRSPFSLPFSPAPWHQLSTLQREARFWGCPTRVFLPCRLLRGRGRLGGQVRGEDCHQSRARVSGVLRRVRQGSLRIDRSSAPVDREGSHCQESFRGLWALHREYGWGPCGWGGEEGTHEIPVSSSSSVKDDIPVELSFFFPNKS